MTTIKGGSGKPSFKALDTGKEDEALATLQDEIQQLRNDRDEERFLLVIVIIVLIDAFIFAHIANWAGAIIIGIIQIFGIAVLARRWRIEEIPQILSKFLDRAADRVHTPRSGDHDAGDPGNAK